MRLCFISTYPPRACGIGTYTESLAESLAVDSDAPPVILAEYGALDGERNGVISRPCYRRDGDYTEDVVRAAVGAHADVVHVQHSPETLGMDERVPRLLGRLRERGIRSVVTLHTVHSRWSGAVERKFGVARFHRSVGDAADALVVHGSHAMANELVRQGVPRAKIHPIAHGTPASSHADRALGRRMLGLPDESPVFLFFGFIHPQKNVHTVVLAMALLRQRVPEARLVVAGSVQNPNVANRTYLKLLREAVDIAGLRDRVSLRIGFVPSEDAPLYYAASDVVLLPYAQGYGSASGIAHNAVGAGRIPLCSHSPKFDEIGTEIDPRLLVSTHSPLAWARAMEDMIQDDARREGLLLKVRRFAERTSWPAIARQHRELYRSLRHTPRGPPHERRHGYDARV